MRRVAHDLRQLAPMIAIACCFAGSATAILVVHHVPTTDLEGLPSVAAARGDRAPSASVADRADLVARGARTQNAAGCPAAPAESGLDQGLEDLRDLEGREGL